MFFLQINSALQGLNVRLTLGGRISAVQSQTALAVWFYSKQLRLFVCAALQRQIVYLFSQTKKANKNK